MGDPYSSGMQKLSEAGYIFNRARDGVWLKAFENTHIEKSTFREQLRVGLGCRLTVDELEALMEHFNNDGYVNGAQFLLLFMRIRAELRDKAQKDKIANDKRAKDIETALKVMPSSMSEEVQQHNERVDFDYSRAEQRSALKKLTDAAAKYDKNMPGAVALDAFDGASLTPGEFRFNLKQCFQLKISPKELGALMDHFDKNKDGFITCQEFLVSFFRLGFDERSRRIRVEREQKAAHAEKLKKAEEEKLVEQERINATKINTEFSQRDKESALRKLRTAAKNYDRTMPGAPSLAAFDMSEMAPHTFQDQLKSTFKLKLTPHELGAVMEVFDVDGNGSISCQEFTKIFLAMGFAEREKDWRAQRAKQKKLIEDREAALKRAEEEKANKNQLEVADEFSDEEFATALGKLTEAAFKYDRNMPGAPNLSAFQMKSMAPHIFKEQLKRAFGIKVTPPELAALMQIFDTEGSGAVDCADFIIKFVKVGTEERMRRKQAWRKHEEEMAAKREQDAVEKRVKQEMKSNLKVEHNFTNEDYASAMAKLTDAAMKYEKGTPGSVGLNAFEGQSMPPHVFKEQLKLVFGIRLLPGELGALMRIFDKDGDGVVNCSEFLMKFFKTGQEERSRVHKAVQAQKKAYLENLALKAKKDAEEKERRAMEEADFDFIEEEFDAALNKMVRLCMVADTRTLGPAGLKIFETATLTPKEFREALKRTFGARVSAQELGALVTLFDTSISGVVSTHSFLSTLVLVRAKLGPFKGKPEEDEMVQKQHDILKQDYIRRITRQMTGEGDGKPWQQVRPNKPQGKGGVVQRKAYPKSAAQKLIRRLKRGKATGRLDLSAKHTWESVKAKHREVMMAEHRVANPTPPPEKPCKASVMENWKYMESILDCIKCFSVDHVGTIEWPTASEHQDELMRLETHIDRVSIEFRLSTLPEEVFFMPSLRELWLDNNLLEVLPAEIASLKQLRTLSVRSNKLSSLPEELCSLEFLQILRVSGNVISALPDSFPKLRKLKELDLEDNKLSEFPPGLLPIVGLEMLNLTNNQVSSLPMELKHMRSLLELHLERNPFGDAPSVLSETPWVKVRADFAVPTGPKSAFELTISHEEEKEFDTFLKKKAKARVARAQRSLDQ